MENATQNKITEYVKEAERQIKAGKGENILPTTTQLRKIFAHINKIQNKAEFVFRNTEGEGLPTEIANELQYLKIQAVYQMARDRDRDRDQKVKKFFEKIGLTDRIDNIKTKTEFHEFCKYMEAIIAYQRYYGKK
ncbi:MAG: type III-A CRISPR-associated protein Csm2 [Eubacteriaceae bacterium]|jgi:CRISPR-associated protein Csm2|nr:type III-A CRISPR-associated protein Csm2 [Eubacteriaceae bacterium]